jgi:hypothetical protein
VKRLDILVPSRGRPANIVRLAQAIASTAARPGAILLRVRLDSDDDAMTARALRQVRSHDVMGVSTVITTGPRIRLAASWNELAAEADAGGATHLALWGDDNIPVTPGWDEFLTGEPVGMAYARDGVWDHTRDTTIPGHLVLPTAVVMPIEIYRALGYVAPPGLVHLCVDVAWRDIGLATGSLIYHPEVLVRHLHRIVGAPDDQTYRDANDNDEQVRADNLAIQAWERSGDFDRAIAAVRDLYSRNGWGG